MGNKIKNSLIIFIICMLYLTSMNMFCISQSEPYIKSNSIVYHTNEDDVVTKLEITIVNPSFKTYSDSFFLRYETKEKYPEGYSSPIYFTLAPLETKTIEITNFRNAWFYNEEYSIEIDREENTTLKITPHNNMFTIQTIANISGIIFLIISIVIIVFKKEKKNIKNV